MGINDSFYCFLKGTSELFYNLGKVFRFYLLRSKNNRKYNIHQANKIKISKQYYKAYFANCKSMGIKPEFNRVKLYISFNNNFDLNYISEEFYKYHIEPVLSPNRYSSTIFQNKALIDQLPKLIKGIDSGVFPITYLRNLSGVFYDVNFNVVFDPIGYIKGLKNNELVYKSNLDTGGGRDVHFFFKDNCEYKLSTDKTLLIDFIKRNSDFILQEKVTQSDITSSLNKTSLNTIRIITYRSVKDEKIHILHSFIRFGSKGQLKDNSGTDSGFSYIFKDGRIEKKKIYRNFKTSHWENELLIPNYDEIIRIAIKVSSFFVFHRIIGYDFALAEKNDVKLIEINPGGLNPEVTNLLTGSFFGEFTGEVMEYVKTKKG